MIPGFVEINFWLFSGNRNQMRRQSTTEEILIARGFRRESTTEDIMRCRNFRRQSAQVLFISALLPNLLALGRADAKTTLRLFYLLVHQNRSDRGLKICSKSCNKKVQKPYAWYESNLPACFLKKKCLNTRSMQEKHILNLFRPLKGH